VYNPTGYKHCKEYKTASREGLNPPFRLDVEYPQTKFVPSYKELTATRKRRDPQIKHKSSRERSKQEKTKTPILGTTNNQDTKDEWE